MQLEGDWYPKSMNTNNKLRYDYKQQIHLSGLAGNLWKVSSGDVFLLLEQFMAPHHIPPTELTAVFDAIFSGHRSNPPLVRTQDGG